jgi:EAL and modified HD-GYP domain-containing signal transduction protein
LRPEGVSSEIEDIVKTDAALSYRFLRMAGVGASRGLSRRLGSVREGVVLIGQQRLRAWVTLILLADHHKSGPDEQLTIAMTRARMAERQPPCSFWAGHVERGRLLRRGSHLGYEP